MTTDSEQLVGIGGDDMTVANRAGTLSAAIAMGDGRAVPSREHAPPAAGSRLRSIAAIAGDALLLLLVVFLVPFAVLLAGLPIAALVWVVVEGVKRLL